jgi:hypothetical protein
MHTRYFLGTPNHLLNIDSNRLPAILLPENTIARKDAQQNKSSKPIEVAVNAAGIYE